MVVQHKEPPSPTEIDPEGNARKRVCKACDRCRLKKSKCDGASPCNRCQSDNAICVFGERKKAHDKVYPKGYVEMLEQQQEKMVNALRELYSRLERHERWPGSPLKRTPKGFVLTHDILERIGMLNLGPDEYDEPFEENPDVLLQRMMHKSEENAYPTPQTIQQEFSPQGSEIMDLFTPSSMSLPVDHVRPSPMMRTPEEQSFIVRSPMSMDPAAHYGWFQTGMNCPDSLNPCPYEIPPTYEGLGIKQERPNPCLPSYDEFAYSGTGEVWT